MKNINFQFFAFLCLCGLFLFVSLAVSAQTKEYTKYVNPFIGTGGHGHTFPGATRPFGMVQLSPDTRIDNWDGSSGYHYSDDIIYGFSHTHLSGTGIPDGADILFMPTIDERQTFSNKTPLIQDASKFASNFLHENEKAEPGYYSVKINDAKLLVELTATRRVGFHRYTFPRSEDAGINVDLIWRDKALKTKLTAVGKARIEGFRQSASWSKNQTVYFVAEFSKQFTEKGDGSNPQGSQGPNIGDENFFFPFSTKDGEQVMVKVAISHVSIEGARKNLEAELPGWDFDRVRADAKDEWNKELSKIEVSGGTDEQTTNFYSALYHTMIHPNVFNDVDGRYKGHDGKIHQLPGYEKLNRRDAVTRKNTAEIDPRSAISDQQSNQYTVFSLWDTFRAAHPLYTIIDEKRTVDFINTFIRQYEQGGRLPVWELWGEETDTMIGYHAVSVIADAMAKGIKGFDYEKAYKASKHSADLDHFGLAGYKKRGYISSEDENESVSKTLEYAYNDWCIAQMGKIILKRRDELHQITSNNTELKNEISNFETRSRSFENLFNATTGFMRPKKNGGFIEPFAPNEVTFSFTEGNSWVYSFFAPHDVNGLINLMGGREKFAAKLDELFTTDQKLTGRFQPDITGLIGQYAHGNEPSHHIPYLYNYVHAPHKTQERVRYILNNFYKNTPDGLIGNEDCGQMSAWYILSASGFYPVTPGKSIYDIGTPLFKEVKYNLENGKTFIIKADKVSQENFYIKSSKLNGKPNDRSYLDHQDIMNGGLLEFEMDNKPNDKAFSKYPGSDSKMPFAAVPIIHSIGPSFTDQAIVEITAAKSMSDIFYTLDGSAPSGKSTKYAGPININKTTVVKALTILPDRTQSNIVEATFSKRLNNWVVISTSGYSTQYTGGGEDGLVDGIRGTKNFSSGEWQGYQGKPFEAIIDLKSETEISEAGGGFLQASGAWIWMPQKIEIAISDDGKEFRKISEIEPNYPVKDAKDDVKEFTTKFAAVKARYIKIKAYNFGKIPEWHLGAGGDPWIFVDEIIIR